MSREFTLGRPILWIFFLFVFIWAVGLLGAFPPSVQAGPSVDLSTAIIRVAKETIPAVVHIEVTERQEVANPFFPFQGDPFFRRFFNTPEAPRSFKREVKGIGTGMILDSQGHILTNFHVAGGATKIEVTLADGNRHAAKLIGGDSKTDLAVIRIEAKERLPHILFGDSDKVEVGEWVVAIGHPRGLNQTVTHGIISAMHRRGITDPSSYQDFLQTDAAINPGNSGGPLLNLRGEVIGVNAAIASESGGSEGIGFAIPSNMASYVAKLLIATGKVERGWLGVSIQDMTPELAKSNHLENIKGVYVAEVVEGGPADKAGIRKGDVVTAFQGKEISNADEFRNLVAVTPVGREAKMILMRNGKKLELAVTVGNLEASARLFASVIKDRLGVSVRPVTQQEAAQYGLQSPRGVAIETVDPKGPLGQAGLEVKDLILAINNQAIAGIDDFSGMAGLLKSKQNVTLVCLDHRTGNTGTIQVTVR
jgi:serine protease Do